MPCIFMEIPQSINCCCILSHLSKSLVRDPYTTGIAAVADLAIQGVANGKIRALPRGRDPSLKIRARDLNLFVKSEPET